MLRGSTAGCPPARAPLTGAVAPAERRVDRGASGWCPDGAPAEESDREDPRVHCPKSGRGRWADAEGLRGKCPGHRRVTHNQVARGASSVTSTTDCANL